MSPAGTSDRSAGHGRKANPRRLVAGGTVFFPAATAYAIFVLPASVFAMLTLNVIVMAMTWTLKALQDPSCARVRAWATIPVGTAALAGLALFDPKVLLPIASAAWRSAFAALLVFHFRLCAQTAAGAPNA